MKQQLCYNNKRLVVASSNAGKLKEFSALLMPLGIQVISQEELGVASVPEPFSSFLENALAKARHAANVTGLAALADDSGLCVSALQGAPGVHSARYAGPLADDSANNLKLLSALHGCTDRRAYYVCVLVWIRSPDDPMPVVIQQAWHGHITETPKGNQGFGYDPYFYIPELGCTAAQLSLADKNQISHRGKALQALLTHIERTP